MNAISLMRSSPVPSGMGGVAVSAQTMHSAHPNQSSSPQPASKNALPPAEPVNAARIQQSHENEPKVDAQALRRAIDQANVKMAATNESISFGYEEKLGQLYVQVKDNRSGDVIRQIPSKEFMQHQIAMSEMIGLILDKQV